MIEREGRGSGRARAPQVVVLSSLFPSSAAPQAGVFIRERMFRVARHLPLVVIAPQAWSPVDALIRRFRPSFRPTGPAQEIMEGIEVHRPRFLSLPGMFKRLDGWSMALAAHRLLKRLVKAQPDTVLDGHFAYPDGFAASVLSRWHGIPMSLTLRGSKDTTLLGSSREPYLRKAVQGAQCVFAVSDALKQTFESRFSLPVGTIEVIRNGVDTQRFQPVPRLEARQRLNIAPDAKVVISVGWLVEGKGHHRIIPIVARMKARYPNLVYLIVGGNAGGVDGRAELEALAGAHGVSEVVRLCGPQAPDDLKWFYGAADVFALATRAEGWANVLLESMACGVPVVTTRVGGNAQVVCDESLGLLTEFWDEAAFERALASALFEREWRVEALVAYAHRCGWDAPVSRLVARFSGLSPAGSIQVHRPSDCPQR